MINIQTEPMIDTVRKYKNLNNLYRIKAFILRVVLTNYIANV